MDGPFNCIGDNDDLINKLKLHGYISSIDVERVFRAVDRGDYIVESQRDLAYKDMSCKVGNIHLSAPCVYSKVMEGLSLQPGLSFLNIGSGTGYLSTIAGLILGQNGTNHGIELHQDCLEYAQQHLEEFKKKSVDMDVFEFCEPVFRQGNFFNVIPNRQYDRVYCGAACPTAHQTFVKQFVKIGGILVMPYKDLLLQIRRISETKWRNNTLLPVFFASLIVPQDEEQGLLQLPLCEPHTLQELCRDLIRRQLRNAVWSEYKDLETKEVIKIVPLERVVTDMPSRWGISFMDIYFRAHRSRVIPRTYCLAVSSIGTLDTFTESLEDSAEEVHSAEAGGESDNGDDSELEGFFNTVNHAIPQKLDFAKIVEEDTNHDDNDNEKMEEDDDEDDSKDLKDHEETKENEDVEMMCEKMESGEQSESKKFSRNVTYMKRKSTSRGSSDGPDDSDCYRDIRQLRGNSHYDLSKNLSNMYDDTDDDGDDTDDDSDSLSISITTSNDDSNDASSASAVESEVSSERSPLRRFKATRENGTTSKRNIDVLANNGELHDSRRAHKWDYCVRRGSNDSSSKKCVVAKSQSAKDDETLERSYGKREATSETVDSDNAKDCDSSSDENSPTNQRESRAGQKRSSQRKFLKFGSAGTSIQKINFSTNQSIVNRKTFSHKIRTDLFSSLMKTKINELPLPPLLRLYLNYNREM